jgi:glutathione S-transferase
VQLRLYSYEHSVYSWIARLALAEKGISYELFEVDPFDANPAQELLSINPLNRVPALSHGRFELYETASITRYIDEAFNGSVLQPQLPGQRAKQNQIIGVLDSDAYWPFVRQVFVHSVYNPMFSEPISPEELKAGLNRSEPVLAALEALVEGQQFLAGKEFSLADIHAFPMLAYLQAGEEGRELTNGFGKLSSWYDTLCDRPTVCSTCPNFLVDKVL